MKQAVGHSATLLENRSNIYLYLFAILNLKNPGNRNIIKKVIKSQIIYQSLGGMVLFICSMGMYPSEKGEGRGTRACKQQNVKRICIEGPLTVAMLFCLQNKSKLKIFIYQRISLEICCSQLPISGYKIF